MLTLQFHRHIQPDSATDDSAGIDPSGSDNDSIAHVVEGPLELPEISYPTLNFGEFTSDENWFVESAPFTVNAMITDFDVCASTAYLTIDRFYPDVENHFSRDSEGDVYEIGAMPLMQISWGTLYDDRKKTGISWLGDGQTIDQYTFQLELRNKDVTAVDDVFESIDEHPDGTLQGKFTVELTHTPK